MPNNINHRWEENFPVELTSERGIEEIADLQGNEIDGPYINDYKILY